MNRKNIFLIIILLWSGYCFALDNTSDFDGKHLKKDIRLIIDFHDFPFFYESYNRLFCNSFNGSIFLGAKLNQFSAGAEIHDYYVSMTAQNDKENYKGAFNIIRGTVDFYYAPAVWVELKFGIGGAYCKSAFSNIEENISKNEGGISFVFDAAFKPPFEYIELKAVNSFNLFFSDISATPYYYGGINCCFHPYFNWISLYLDAGVMTFIYNGKPKDVSSAMFTWGFGMSFDLSFPSIIKYTKGKTTIKSKQEKTEIKKEEPENETKSKPEKKETKNENINVDTKIEELKKIEQGETITFNNIIFYSNSDKIKEESYAVLDKIAAVLKDRENLKIEIRGHTNNTNNPKAELKLSQQRAEMVRIYLIHNGIKPENLTGTGYGSQFTTNSTIDEANRKVEFLVLDDKK